MPQQLTCYQVDADVFKLSLMVLFREFRRLSTTTNDYICTTYDMKNGINSYNYKIIQKYCIYKNNRNTHDGNDYDNNSDNEGHLTNINSNKGNNS